MINKYLELEICNEKYTTTWARLGGWQDKIVHVSHVICLFYINMFFLKCTFLPEQNCVSFSGLSNVDVHIGKQTKNLCCLGPSTVSGHTVTTNSAGGRTYSIQKMELWEISLYHLFANVKFVLIMLGCSSKPYFWEIFNLINIVTCSINML